MGPVVTQAAQGCAALRTPPGGSRQRADSRPGVALCSQQGRGQGGGVFLRSQPLKPSHLCAPSTETKTREGDTEAKPARMTRPRLHTQGLLGAARQKPRLLAPHASIRAARPRGAGVRPPTLGTCRPQGPQAAPPPGPARCSDQAAGRFSGGNRVLWFCWGRPSTPGKFACYPTEHGIEKRTNGGSPEPQFPGW